MSAPALSVVRPEHGGGNEGEMGLFELIREWDAFLELSGKAARTRSSYRYMLLRFLADVMIDLRSITEREILDHLRTLDPHGGKRGDIIRALKSFFGWAVKREHVRINPVVDLRIPRPRDGRAPRPSEEELTRLVDAARAYEPRRAWAILFVYGTGARVGSACEVRPEDVREGRVYFRQVKNDRPYDIPLVGVAAEAVEELLKCRRPVHATNSRHTDHLIGVGTERFRQWVRDAERDSGVRAWPHLLRHTFATRVYEETRDPALTAELLNHRDLSQIRRYVAVDEGDKLAALRRL